jgi:unsaturated rhamnogalacturonyl hydrolase
MNGTMAKSPVTKVSIFDLVGLSCVLLLAGCGNSGTAAGTGGGSPGGMPGVGSGGTSPTTGGSNGNDGGPPGGGGSNSGGSTGAGGRDGSGGSGGQSGTGGSPGEQGGGSGAGGQTVGTGGTRTGGAGGGQAAGSGGAPIGGAAGTRAGGNGGTTNNGGRGGGGGGGGGNGGGTPAAFDRVAVTAIMRRVADYEITRFGTGNDNGWVRAAFHTGMLAAYRALEDAKYRDYTMQWAGTANAWKLHADGNGLRFADNQACVQSYAELYLADPRAQNDVMIAAAQTTFDAMVAAPMTGRTEWWWCDSLFMAPPALARVAQATGKTQYLTLMHNMFWDTKAFLFDPAQSLFWRDGTFRNTNTYWSRGNGWVVAGIARILDVLPAADPRRTEYETLLRQMATKLASIQASDGFWRSSLTQPNAYTTPESSGTAFFCFGIAWGINHGVLDRATFLPTVVKAWNALVSAVNAQGRLGWVQAVGAMPGPSQMADTNDYATGALLLSGSEILKL